MKQHLGRIEHASGNLNLYCGHSGQLNLIINPPTVTI